MTSTDLAFVILAHDDSETLAGLLAAISPYPAFLHLDRSATKAGRFNELRVPDSVLMNPDPHCVHWGGYSVVRAMIETLQFALESKLLSRDARVVFLSGHCYPVRPIEEFRTYLAEMPWQVHCRAFCLDQGAGAEMSARRVTERHWLDGAAGHIKKRWSRRFGGALRRAMWAGSLAAPKVEVPAGTVLACGSQWTALPVPLAEEIVREYRAGGFDYLRNAYAPDEIAIPTFVYNSSWKDLTQNGALEGPPPKVAELSNFHWMRASMAGFLTYAEVEDARKSGAYFARKVVAADIVRGAAGVRRGDDGV